MDIIKGGNTMAILKILFLFLAVIYLVTIVGRLVHKDVIYGTQIVLFAVGFVGFITLQFNLI